MKDEAPRAPSKQLGRNIPWLQVARFHQEIAERGENSFFSLGSGGSQAKRWTSLDRFDPESMAGPWALDFGQLRSKEFEVALHANEHAALFLGGPCFLGWEKAGSSWRAKWQPLLYREVRALQGDSGLELIPSEGHWNLSPIALSALERQESSSALQGDELVTSLIEHAEIKLAQGGISLEQAILQSTLDLIPDLESTLNRPRQRTDFDAPPSPWVLFAPTNQFSAFSRNLIEDYRNLIQRLESNPDDLGGLHVLEDTGTTARDEGGSPIPLVPLDETQDQAVRRILDGQAVTVVSGPPGCGKSQVVVSTILNAWARGQTVLFASNNNQAVDVVRERLEKFETDFPIAVRAGNRAKNNAEEVLRRTLNLVATRTGSRGASRAEEWPSQQRPLEQQRSLLHAALASELPQRLDEGLKASLRAYSKSNQLREEAHEAQVELESQFDNLPLQGITPQEAEEALHQIRAWKTSLSDTSQNIAEDRNQFHHLTKGIAQLAEARNSKCAEAGLITQGADTQKWFVSAQLPDQLEEWISQASEIFSLPLEERLKEHEWDPAFERWSSQDAALDSAGEARDLATCIRGTLIASQSKIQEVESRRERWEQLRSKVVRVGLSLENELCASTLDAWSDAWAALSTHTPSLWDRLPWSEPARQKRRLRGFERQFRSQIPAVVWGRIGALDQEGRKRLAKYVDILRALLRAQTRWDNAQEARKELQDEFDLHRARAASLGAESIPEDLRIESWQAHASQLELLSQLAQRASVGWGQRQAREGVATQIRSLIQSFHSQLAPIPIIASWVDSAGKSGWAKLVALHDHLDLASIGPARAFMGSGSLEGLLTTWRDAVQLEIERVALEVERASIPTEEQRRHAWWDAKPALLRLSDRDQGDWLTHDQLASISGDVSAWKQSWAVLHSYRIPRLIASAREEESWALENLNQVIDQLPKSSHTEELSHAIEQLRADPDREWPIEKLRAAFEQWSPEQLRARIRGIEAELERGSFEEAKRERAMRLARDREALASVDALMRHLKRTRGKVHEDHFDAFRSSLRATPIWITTAQAPQSIPLLPNLFDIVIIDEASQCTLTNLLPLVYRGKRLVVIGDENQLRAIPTVQAGEERALATKHDVSPFLDLIGHAENDVYNAACQCLPRRRADVTVLRSHYRSHPQIIGFSNTRIYQRELEIQTRASDHTFALGSGVHARHVVGQCERGERGRSWRNHPEAHAVCKLVEELRSSSPRHTLGIVTPFAAQKELIQSSLSQLSLLQGVTVGTAHAYQGDERDIMIFSPVIAPGIESQSARWVENPPNLINVAVTRARRALFVVGDLDACEQQDGIMSELALYCRSVELLRSTSDAELELFSWLCLKGWNPAVHPMIGDLEVDFVLESTSGVRLAIEVDGREFHENRTARDRGRDAFLTAEGYRVHRIPARAVLETPFEVVRGIGEALCSGDLA